MKTKVCKVIPKVRRPCYTYSYMDTSTSLIIELESELATSLNTNISARGPKYQNKPYLCFAFVFLPPIIIIIHDNTK